MPDDQPTPVDETPTDPTPNPAPPPPAPPVDEFDPERAMNTIRTLRDEVKAAKAEAKQAKDLKARLDAIEAEQLTEQERRQKEHEATAAERDALRAETRADKLRLAVYAAQQSKGIADVDLAIAALNHAAIEYDDAGHPTNVDGLLDDLLDEKPILRAAPKAPTIPPTDGSSRDNAPPDLTADELEAARATGMTPDAFAAWKKASAGGRIDVLAAAAALHKKG